MNSEAYGDQAAASHKNGPRQASLCTVVAKGVALGVGCEADALAAAAGALASAPH